MHDILTKDAIISYLGADAHRFALTVLPSVTSTNTALREAALSGAAAGTVLVAEAQSAGRGRQGRSFFSPDASGLYISLLLRPRAAICDATRLTIAAAVAAAEAIREVTEREVAVKWVNDLFLDGKKVAGILAEGALSPDGTHLDYAVVGIGINLYAPAGGFPAELSDIAGAISPCVIEDGRARLAASFLRRMTASAEALSDGAFMDEYRRRCFVLGRRVTVLRGAEAFPAEALSLTDDGALVVRLADGTEHALTSGEIRVRPD